MTKDEIIGEDRIKSAATSGPDCLKGFDEETAEEIRRIFSPMPDEILRQAQEDFDTAEDLPLSPDEVAYAERLVRALGGEG